MRGTCLLSVSADQTARLHACHRGHWCEIARPQVSICSSSLSACSSEAHRNTHPSGLLSNTHAPAASGAVECSFPVLQKTWPCEPPTTALLLTSSCCRCRCTAMTLRAWPCCQGTRRMQGATPTSAAQRRRCCASWRPRRPSWTRSLLPRASQHLLLTPRCCCVDGSHQRGCTAPRGMLAALARALQISSRCSLQTCIAQSAQAWQRQALLTAAWCIAVAS